MGVGRRSCSRPLRTSDEGLITERSPASFRDPSGFVFRRDGVLYRQIHASYEPHYQRLRLSGLYDELVAEGLLVAHDEVSPEIGLTPEAVRVLRPMPIEMISYPYEWCFGQLRDAALLTLELQQRAMKRGLGLKDASAYNIQFQAGRPVLIDTLSFATYQEGQPWIAYLQFCQHFLAPLLLMAHVDARLGRLLAIHLDGIPLDLVSRLLPKRTWLRPSTLLHIHLHARSIAKHGRRIPKGRQRVSRGSLEALLGNLHTTIQHLDWKPKGTQWVCYEEEHAYAEEGLQEKRRVVAQYLQQLQPKTVWDLGGNVGTFSRVAAEAGALVVAVDSDVGALEVLYRRLRRDEEGRILPLLADLTNPSPGLGWAHRERASLVERGPADCLLALALIHHLAISGNLPLPLIAEWFASIGRALIVEFVPKEDPQAQRLLSGRTGMFAGYTREAFQVAFTPHFRILRTQRVRGTERELFLMERTP